MEYHCYESKERKRFRLEYKKVIRKSSTITEVLLDHVTKSYVSALTLILDKDDYLMKIETINLIEFT